MDIQTRNIPVKSRKNGKPSIKPVGKALSDVHPIADMERAFERVLDRFASLRMPSLSRWSDLPAWSDWVEEMEVRMPSLDVVDRDNDILVRAEVPGIEKKDIDVTMTDNLLTIKGQSRKEVKEEKGNYHRHEISSSAFARSVTLPGAVNTSKATAALKDGILEITLPKMEASKRRSISVK